MLAPEITKISCPRESAEGSREGAESGGGLQTDGSSRGSSSKGLRAGTHRNCALGNQYPWMTPKGILILPSLQFYKAELSSQLGATTVANVSPVPCRTRWPPRWTPFPRWSCHPPVSLCRKWCFICCSREQLGEQERSPTRI